MEPVMRVAKWGNDLAIRLPRSVVETLGLKEGDAQAVSRQWASATRPYMREADVSHVQVTRAIGAAVMPRTWFAAASPAAARLPCRRAEWR